VQTFNYEWYKGGVGKTGVAIYLADGKNLPGLEAGAGLKIK